MFFSGNGCHCKAELSACVCVCALNCGPQSMWWWIFRWEAMMLRRRSSGQHDRWRRTSWRSGRKKLLKGNPEGLQDTWRLQNLELPSKPRYPLARPPICTWEALLVTSTNSLAPPKSSCATIVLLFLPSIWCRGGYPVSCAPFPLACVLRDFCFVGVSHQLPPPPVVHFCTRPVQVPLWPRCCSHQSDGALHLPLPAGFQLPRNVSTQVLLELPPSPECGLCACRTGSHCNSTEDGGSWPAIPAQERTCYILESHFSLTSRLLSAPSGKHPLLSFSPTYSRGEVKCPV